MNTPNISVNLAGINLRNPIIAASGTFGYGLAFQNFLDLGNIGGFVTKGISLKPRVGNPDPRICETPSGMLNSIGLHNVGLEKFITSKMPEIRKVDTSVIVNFFGETVEEYVELANRLDQVEGIDGLEMNISCPNVNKGGSSFDTDLSVTCNVVNLCRKATKKPLIVKLSPNVGDIVEFAKACEDNGADAISAINTLVGMAIDIKSRKPLLAKRTGGLSGPAIKPIAVRMVNECYRSVKIPIIGIGGIATVQDIIEFTLAGATAIQIGTMNFVDPAICEKLAAELAPLLNELGVDNLHDLIGQVS